MEDKPVRRRPPRTLQLPASNDAGQGQDEKREVASQPTRKHRNSALIEKLQANLTISPTALLPSPVSPGAAKHQQPCFSTNQPSIPASPTAVPKPGQEEAPTSFEKPVEGSVLLSINKGRARHSIKRRPPSRRHRKSSGDDIEPEEEKAVLPVSECAAPDGNEEEVFEKKKLEKKNVDSAEPASFNSEQQKEQNPNASTDAELQPTTEGEKQSKTCKEAPVCAENEKMLEEEEKKPDETELDDSTSQSTKHEEPHEDPAMEPQSEPDRVTEGKEGQEKEEKAGDSQTEECKCSEH